MAKKSALTREEKRALISKTILQVLGTKTLQWGDLADRVSAKLKKFEGSVPHYVVLCLGDLKRAGKVRRLPGRVALYSRK